MAPVVFVELIVSFSDAIEEGVLAVSAGAAVTPVAVGGAAFGSVKWRVAAEQHVENDAEGPQVASFVVGRRVTHETLNVHQEI